MCAAIYGQHHSSGFPCLSAVKGFLSWLLLSPLLPQLPEPISVTPLSGGLSGLLFSFAHRPPPGKVIVMLFHYG